MCCPSLLSSIELSLAAASHAAKSYLTQRIKYCDPSLFGGTKRKSTAKSCLAQRIKYCDPSLFGVRSKRAHGIHLWSCTYMNLLLEAAVVGRVVVVEASWCWWRKSSAQFPLAKNTLCSTLYLLTLIKIRIDRKPWMETKQATQTASASLAIVYGIWLLNNTRSSLERVLASIDSKLSRSTIS